MALLHIPLEQIDQSHLQALIDLGAVESRSIEYKRETYGPTDQTEFLNDISSFANTSGGDLVLGMTAEKGIPTKFAPLTIDLDAEKLRLEQIARTGLQPRLPKLELHPVAVEDGFVLIVRIPRSFTAPHRVIRQNGARFWARSTAGKYEPDVGELRQLFLAAPQLADRIRNFRLDRVAKIAADEAPVRLMKRGTLVIHIVPLSAFDIPSILPLQQLARDLYVFSPIGSRAATSSRINFDGILKLSNADEDAKQQSAYVQLFHSGIVEAVNSTIKHSEHATVFNLEDSLANNTLRFLTDVSNVGIQPPYALLVSFLDVNGARMDLARGGSRPYYDDLGTPFDRDQYHFGEVIYDTVPQTQEQAATVIRPILDQIANAAGSPASRSFHPQNGRYIPLRT